MAGRQLDMNHFESQKHSFCIEFEKSWSRCRSLTGRLDQHFVFGRLDDCSSLKECCASICDNSSRLRKPVSEWGQIENRCFELWASYENVVGSNVETEVTLYLAQYMRLNENAEPNIFVGAALY